MEDKTENGKYYVPTIEEFHYGFEYEAIFKDGWHKQVYKEPDLYSMSDVIEGISLGYLRVKYLDSEDIENCGWKPHMIGYKMGEYTLSFHRKSFRNISIHRDSQMGADHNQVCYFCGTIRNISELKRIMKQVGI